MSRIYLTNSATVDALAWQGKRRVGAQTRASVGPEGTYNIMRWPGRMRPVAEGRVLAFMPTSEELRRAKAGMRADDTAAWTEYEAALRRRWGLMRVRAEQHGPGLLTVYRSTPNGGRWDDQWWTAVGTVEDGATLVCACSRASAAAGRCHRVLAAEFLAAAGWEVILDGAPFAASCAA